MGISCIGLSHEQFTNLKQLKYKCPACIDVEVKTSKEQQIKKDEPNKSVINEADVPMLEFIDNNISKTKKKKRIKFTKKNKTKSKKKNKRLITEGRNLLLNPTPGIGACPRVSFKDISNWIGFIEGPQNTPYEGYRFYLTLEFGEKYPFKAPKVMFKTKIYHCNVSENGTICLNILKNDWSPLLSIEKILLSLCVLLSEPNPYDPLVADIAELYLMNRLVHDRTARAWTERYAQSIKDSAHLFVE